MTRARSPLAASPPHRARLAPPPRRAAAAARAALLTGLLTGLLAAPIPGLLPAEARAQSAPLPAAAPAQGDAAAQRTSLPQRSFDCVIEPAQTLRIAAQAAGTLRDVLVERGDRVTRGQVLAALHDELEAADLRKARAEAESDAMILSRRAALALAQAESLRSRSLLARGIATEAQGQEAEAALQAARMELRQAELARSLAAIEAERAAALLERRLIRSPIDGIVVERARGPGEYVYQENHVLTLAQTDPLHVEAWLPVALHPSLALGRQVSVTLEQPAGEIRAATISILDAVFDAATGTFGLRAILPNPEGAAPGGQRCTLTLPAD